MNSQKKEKKFGKTSVLDNTKFNFIMTPFHQTLIIASEIYIYISSYTDISVQNIPSYNITIQRLVESQLGEE